MRSVYTLAVWREGSSHFHLGQSGKGFRYLTPAWMNGLDVDPSKSGGRAFLPKITAQAKRCTSNKGVQLALVKRLL